MTLISHGVPQLGGVKQDMSG